MLGTINLQQSQWSTCLAAPRAVILHVGRVCSPFQKQKHGSPEIPYIIIHDVSYLVGALEHFLVSHILGIIIPID